MKIHDKLWFINRGGSELAYMTYYEDNKAFTSRKGTGLKWACAEGHDGYVVPNEPQSGFSIVESVSRWSTSNKLFRVRDPRGFVVEIPTGNLSTLLQCATVSNGLVKGECVWGRDGSNHILLPVNSEPYKEAKENTEKLNNPLKVKDLEVGDVVKAACGTLYLYTGKYRLTLTAEVASRELAKYGQAVKGEIHRETSKLFSNKWVPTFIRGVLGSDGSMSFDDLKVFTGSLKLERLIGREEVKQVYSEGDLLKSGNVPRNLYNSFYRELYAKRRLIYHISFTVDKVEYKEK